jgi:hypothetical protein
MIGRMMSGLTVVMLAAGACSTKPAEALASAVTPASTGAAGYAPVVSLNEIMLWTERQFPPEEGKRP